MTNGVASVDEAGQMKKHVAILGGGMAGRRERPAPASEAGGRLRESRTFARTIAISVGGTASGKAEIDPCSPRHPSAKRPSTWRPERFFDGDDPGVFGCFTQQVALPSKAAEPATGMARQPHRAGLSASTVTCTLTGFTAFDSLIAAATTNSGILTSFAFAQATFWALVKQQHFRQHCSAVWQPQGRFWHGKGADESFSAPGSVGRDKGRMARHMLNRTAQPTSRRSEKRPNCRAVENIRTGRQFRHAKQRLALHSENHTVRTS